MSGYPDWCDECGWNVHPPPPPDRPQDRRTRVADAIGRRSGERMARELLAARELKPRWTPAKLTAYAVAAAVHLVTLLLIAGLGSPSWTGAPEP